MVLVNKPPWSDWSRGKKRFSDWGLGQWKWEEAFWFGEVVAGWRRKPYSMVGSFVWIYIYTYTCIHIYINLPKESFSTLVFWSVSGFEQPLRTRNKTSNGTIWRLSMPIWFQLIFPYYVSSPNFKFKHSLFTLALFTLWKGPEYQEKWWQKRPEPWENCWGFSQMQYRDIRDEDRSQGFDKSFGNSCGCFCWSCLTQQGKQS